MNVRAWRIVNARHSAGAFSGDGARKFGGRWNSVGVGVVYTAQSLSLATLEILVGGAPFGLLNSYVKIPVDLDDSAVFSLSVLPRGWDAYPSTNKTREIGDAWARELKSPVLKVPSSIIPEESIFIINPAHPETRKKVTFGKSEKFIFDKRLAGRTHTPEKRP